MRRRHTHTPLRRRAAHAAVALALVAAGCTSKTERAAQYDALADQMLAAEAYPAAIGTLQNALRLDGNNADRWVKMGRAQRQLDMLPMAATSYQRALELAPDNLEALQAISVLLVRGGQFDLAKTYIATLTVLAPNDIGGLLAQGAIALHENRLIDADKLAERIMTLAPQVSEGFIMKARVLELRGQPRAAAAILSKRLAFDGRNSDLAVQVLRLDRKVGNLQGVRDTALVLAKLVPDDPRYQLEAARTLRARGRPAEAERILDKAEQRWRGNPQVMLSLAREWLDTRPHAAAMNRIVGLIGAAPPHTRAALAGLLIDVGEAGQALALLQPSLGGKADAGTVEARGIAARALLALGRAPEAQAQAAQVLAFDARNPEALLVRARLAAARKDYGRALDDAQVVMADEPRNREAPLLIARFWAAQGNAVMADKAYGTAQDRFPEDLGILQARVAWLLSERRADDAAALATAFVNQHGGGRDAVALQAQACGAAGDTLCVASARRKLARG